MNNDGQYGDSFVVNVYSSGNQIIKTQNNNYYGPVYQGSSENQPNNIAGEQDVKRLLDELLLAEKDGKPLMTDQGQWWAVYRVLNELCNYTK